MFDTRVRIPMQRSHGEAAVAFVAQGERAGLSGLRQRGSGKVLLPHLRGVPEAVFLNTSGGLTSGDTLAYRVTLGEGVRAVATTQAAERAYRAEQGPAQVTVEHRVEAGGWLDWLPQETILFDGANLNRQTRVTLAPGAGCLLLEVVILGRAAMGEHVRTLQFSDIREVHLAQKPIFSEPLVLNSNILRQQGNPAILAGARAFATLALIAPGAEDALEPARRVLDEPGVEGAASAFDGKLVLRLLAADGWPLRRQILKLMDVLRRGAPPPRVWQL
jgi:urease accessory protein